MPTATVTFERLVQDSQDFGGNDEHMVSRVYFSLEVDDKVHSNLYANVKQPVGSNFESAPLEVSKPVGYKGPFVHAVFSSSVERYYRGLVGSAGRVIHITGARDVRMRNNTFGQPGGVQFEVNATGGPW